MHTGRWARRSIERHLRGHVAIGIYPLLPGDRCWFLAFDLDGRSWQRDACALAETAHGLGVAAAIERSRSGDGAHVWVFFAEPVLARAARQLGALLLRETMRWSDLDLSSYDRLFPNQDLLPENGFGNLIAAMASTHTVPTRIVGIVALRGSGPSSDLEKYL